MINVSNPAVGTQKLGGSGLKESVVVDDNATRILKNIEVELKINNEQLHHLTGEKITSEDVEIAK